MLALTIATGVLKLLDSLITLGYTYRQRRLGAWGEIFYWLKIVDTDDLQKRHWEINCWQDEEVSAWKTAFLSSCNAVAVAVSMKLHLRAASQLNWTLGRNLCQRRCFKSNPTKYRQDTLDM